ncbi:MAG: biotin transporter BioY [Lachnospiraceae bacterium]|nr:biotin transporter BioY [Lachnospiraceae bacterium]
MKENKTLSVKNIAIIGVMTAITCILGPLSIQIGVVPISFTNLAIYLGLYILGVKKGTISYLVYLLLGLVGVPVFSAFSAGPQKLFGPTGGYLIGFIAMALIAGIFIEKSGRKFVLSMVGMILGTVVCYGFGTAWLAFQAHYTFAQALAAGVTPFIVGDLLKMVLVALVAPQIYKALLRANVLTEAQTA